MRDTTGRFLPGKSGNPGGRPRVILAVRDQAQQLGEEAIEVLAKIMRQADAPPAARISAASEILNRGYGRSLDQRAMLIMSKSTDMLSAVNELSMDALLSEFSRLAELNMIDGTTLAIDHGD